MIIMKLEDRVALITGGNQGIGRSIALAFAREGAKVVITARNEERLREMLSELKRISPDARAFPADIGDQARVRVLFDEIRTRDSRIDILANNTSITGPTRKLTEITTAEWREVLQINLRGHQIGQRLPMHSSRSFKRSQCLKLSTASPPAV